MATSTESEAKSKPSENLLQSYKGDTCPSCGKSHLHTNDSDQFDEIVNYICMACGFGFYEDEQGRERRKDKKKADEDRNLWNGGFLILVAMLAAVLLINLEREREQGSYLDSASAPIERRL